MALSNAVFARFKTRDFVKIKDVLNSLHPVLRVKIHPEQVMKLFQWVKICKAQGPDGTCGKTLSFCTHKLGDISQYLFQCSMDSLSIPTAWKLFVIVPVPKRVSAQHLNEFRPVALTFLVMRVLKTIIKALILKATNKYLDYLKFAYQSKESVHDAKLLILHTLFKHLQNQHVHAWLLFADFSLSFNTIQPPILITRLWISFPLAIS